MLDNTEKFFCFLFKIDGNLIVIIKLLSSHHTDLAVYLNDSVSNHKLRHTAATLMYQSGNVDVRILKEILGHAQLNTTQIYTHVSNSDMEEAMKFNPLANQQRKK